MGYQPIEDLLPKSGYSIYKLVRLASNRAMELADGKRKLVEDIHSEKLSTIALEEIMAGKVVLKEVADQFTPLMEGKQEDKRDAEEVEVS